MKSILQYVQQLCEYLLDQIVPPRSQSKIVSSLTFEQIRSVASNNTLRNSLDIKILPYRSQITSALIWELKYHRNRRALSISAQLIADEILGIISEELAPPVLVPIPMHATRKIQRGYNQTALLCEEVAQLIGESVIYEPDALKRTRHTTPQQKLARHARLKNVKNSMNAGVSIVRGRTIIIVDDVTTTGATIAEARRALTKAGACRVYSIALAG